MVAGIAGVDEPRLVLGWVLRVPEWVGSTDVPVSTLLVGAGLRAAVAGGKVRAVAVRLSALPALLASRLRPDVAVVAAHRHRARWLLATGPGYALDAARHARRLVVESRPAPPPPGAPELPSGRICAVYDGAEPADPPPAARSTPELRRIGRLVADLLPDGATLQWGPGAVGSAVVDALDRPVRVRSGLVGPELAALASRGLLAGKAEAAYIWGGAEVWDLVEARGVAYTHDISALSALERFVAVNTALQVGLDGAANVEVAWGRVVSGPGGHPDFAAGASRSPGGLSIVALPSTAGGRSTIVARPEVVSTPRSDVDVVVTEHGAADLRGLTDRERADALISVAAPEHREALRCAAPDT